MSEPTRDDLLRMLDAVWPIVEGAKLLRARYSGKLDGVPKVCPDQAGVIIKALNTMERTCNFERVDEVPDGND